MKVTDLRSADDIACEELRDPGVLLHWLLQYPRHAVTLAWLRFRAGRSDDTRRERQ